MKRHTSGMQGETENSGLYQSYMVKGPLLDGSFEHQKHMLKLMGKKIFTVLR